MKNKLLLIVILLVFILLMVGAYGLYNQLSVDIATQQLAVTATVQPTDAPAATQAPANDTAAQATAEPDPEPLLAPDFTVYDKAGNAVHLSDFFGKPIVLNFWASWCGPCRSEMPDFDAKYAEIGEDVHFLMINLTEGRETIETATAFIQQQGYSFPIYYDTTAMAAMTYGAYSIPTSYFINAQGHVVARAVGAINAATLQKGIDMISD